ncbi:MAG: penicillin-binding protein 2 [Chloroflexota bacterium]|nr:penicillin-binding protein 2 [Chloroflexota bacterium]
MAEGPRRRLLLLITVLIGCLIVVVAQLVKVQVVDHQFYKTWALEQQVRAITMDNAPRGVITDRDGHLLAGNGVRYAVEAAPAYVVDTEAAAVGLASMLHMPASHVETLLDSRDEDGELRKWIQIAPSVPPETGEAVIDLGIGGVTVRPLWRRMYPEETLASHTLGFSTMITGYYGVEGYYDDLLRPEVVEWVAPVDVSSVPIPWQPIPGELPRRGVNLELTLDRTVQALAEEELRNAVWEHEAEGGTIIVMEPETFGILAMASCPAYDPERYTEFADDDPPPFEDPAISKQYEPGSVFKILTVAAALDAGIVRPETIYNDQGWIEVGGQTIRNATGKSYGESSVADLLIKSLNVGAAWVSKQMGPDVFYRYLQDFGIGERTNVDLAGEVTGQLWLPEDIEHWHPSNLGTNSFGQGVAVTPLQMVTAVATVANDGARLRPHVVGRRIASDGTVSVYQPVLVERVISPETARQLTEIMVRIVEDEVTLARVEGYRVAGKTGTAQIPIPGGYAREGTIATFAGFGPMPDPELVVLVKLDRPQSSQWASMTAAPTFQRLMSRLFTALAIPPEGDRMVAEVRE